MTRQSRSFDPAQLPDGLRSRGKPLSVHQPWQKAFAAAQARFFERLFGAKDAHALGVRLAFFGLAGLVFLGGLVFVWAYLYRPPRNEDPHFLLIAAAATFVFGLVLVVCGVLYRGRGDKATSDSGPFDPNKDTPDLYLVYPDGLAAVAGNAFDFLAWDEVEEVTSVWRKMNRQLVVKSGDERSILVWNGFTDMGGLKLAIYQGVNNVLLPRALTRLAEGKSVRFGPFALHRSGLKYKDRKASWDKVTSMKIINHNGDVRLTIYTEGRMLAFCWCDVNKIPNWNTFYDALCRTAPEHLLTTSTRPRW